MCIACLPACTQQMGSGPGMPTCTNPSLFKQPPPPEPLPVLECPPALWGWAWGPVSAEAFLREGSVIIAPAMVEVVIEGAVSTTVGAITVLRPAGSGTLAAYRDTAGSICSKQLHALAGSLASGCHKGTKHMQTPAPSRASQCQLHTLC